MHSGDAPRTHNPNKYRSPAFYDNLIKTVFFQDFDGTVYGFELLTTKVVETYVKVTKVIVQQVHCWYYLVAMEGW
jgi:hypothetical protein